MLDFSYSLKCKVNDHYIEPIIFNKGDLYLNDLYIGSLELNDYGDPLVSLQLDSLYCASDLIEPKKYKD